ncbi:sigma-70 family RNA polymerase sigma factor [Botrimarina hoheduenensis]|uniref:RNA polymerase sigma factor CarQ n=1 Tax=Botrimarina hoheduenensis TaxID=2528000 RepID=A0A5C5WET8_9BACT|nr:sigma-70 family RNA polymerase sigma factor [Botrimarina hoheduenensis]TWT48591.1 RNA polymerase sigma factor CarQ [Botrimarina hoheduenensis]
MIATNRLPLDTTDDDESGRAAFARVFAQHDRWLYAYLMTLLGKPAHAEEVFQEVCVVLWREYRKFDLETNFMKWASVVALNQVRKFRRNLRRNEAWLSEGLLEVLAEEAIDNAGVLETRRHALHDCVSRLAADDREVVRACYGDSRTTIKEAAERLGRPANSLYKAMARIRRALHDCITRRLRAEGY